MDHLDADDHALLTMEFEEGVVGTLQTSGSSGQEVRRSKSTATKG